MRPKHPEPELSEADPKKDDPLHTTYSLPIRFLSVSLSAVIISSNIYVYGISTATLKNLWSELVGYCQSPPFSNVSLPHTL